MKYRFIIIFIIILVSSSLAQNVTNGVMGDTILASIDTTIWKYLSLSDSSRWTITKADSEKAFKDHFVKGYTVYKKVDKIFKRIDRGRIKYEGAVSELSYLLPQVKDHFEQGLKLNPFDTYLRQAIVPVYYKLFQLYQFKKDDGGRLQILHNLSYMQKDRKIRIQLYNQIGRIYFRYKLWEQAKNNFRLAVDYIFEGEESELDSLQIYRNIYYRGQAYVKLYNADSALISIGRARMVAPSEKEYQQMSDLLDYINWDQGNIYASEQYMQTRVLVSKKEYEQAEKAYVDLLEIIKSERARDEAIYRLARIQFNNLQKHDEAIARLWNVVKKYYEHPLPDSSAYVSERDYWETYGFMCIQLANKAYNENRKLSFIYFLKASQVECQDQARAYLGLASLSLNNPDVCLDYCGNALKNHDLLTPQEIKNLYNLFYLSYSRKGEFKESMKWYEKYHKI